MNDGKFTTDKIDTGTACEFEYLIACAGSKEQGIMIENSGDSLLFSYILWKKNENDRSNLILRKK